MDESAYVAKLSIVRWKHAAHRRKIVKLGTYSR